MGTSYLQPFPVTIGGQLGPANRFLYTEKGSTVSVPFREDFIPFSFSASAHLSGGVVFAGYGITAPEYHYDDYAGNRRKG